MSLRQICNAVFRQHLRPQSAFVTRFFATEAAESKNEIIDIATVDEKPVYLHNDLEAQKQLAKKRNKSRLNPEHRNILMGLRPYDSPKAWHHNTVKYKRRMLGRYGLKDSDEPVGFAWPTLKEVKNMQEYERVAYPLSLQDNLKKLEEEKKEKAEQIAKREDEMLKKLGKMEQWTAELHAKIAKKEATLKDARLRKERVVEEVRRYFGYKISIHNEKFKEMLAQKEKEEKKEKKEAKKQARLEKMKKFFQQKDANNVQTTESTKSAE